MKWRAWDAEGKSYSSKDTCPCDLPETLQFVVVYKDTGREVHTGSVTPELDRWYGFGSGRLVDLEGERPDGGEFTWKRGTLIDSGEYEKIAEEVYASKWQ